MGQTQVLQILILVVQLSVCTTYYIGPRSASGGFLVSLVRNFNTTEVAYAGEFSQVNISFMSAVRIPAGGNIRVRLSNFFALCQHSKCGPESTMEICSVLHAQVQSVTGYSNTGKQNWTISPALKHNEMCVVDGARALVCDQDE